jgi:Family of unknown function (DUF5762)
MNTPFWSNDPTILLKKEYIIDVFPNNIMTFEEKLNAITRLVLLLTLLGYISTKSIKVVILGIVTMVVIFTLYQIQKNKTIKGILRKEGFSGSASPSSSPKALPRPGESLENQVFINPETLDTYLKSDFEPNTKKNPLGNVLLTDIMDDPKRRAAPPSFNTEVYENINKTTKKMVQMLNPGIKDTNQQLFGDLGEQFQFDQSMWQYYATPNTKIPNDQGAFADYLYGDMPSCRDGDTIQCVKDNFRYNLY